MKATKVYEIDTWRGRDELNKKAIEAAKSYKGKKYTVTIGEWGVKTYLIFADSKEEAKDLALRENAGKPVTACNNPNKMQIREVTNCKKYK